jgi:hypothetical protein
MGQSNVVGSQQVLLGPSIATYQSCPLWWTNSNSDDLLTALAAQMKDLRQVSRCISASPAGFTNSSPVVSGNGTMAAKMPQLLDCEF